MNILVESRGQEAGAMLGRVGRCRAEGSEMGIGRRRHVVESDCGQVVAGQRERIMLGLGHGGGAEHSRQCF